MAAVGGSRVSGFEWVRCVAPLALLGGGSFVGTETGLRVRGGRMPYTSGTFALAGFVGTELAV